MAAVAFLIADVVWTEAEAYAPDEVDAAPLGAVAVAVSVETDVATDVVADEPLVDGFGAADQAGVY